MIPARPPCAAARSRASRIGLKATDPIRNLLGDFAAALDDAVMDSSDAHQNPMHQVLSNKEVAAGFGKLVFDMLVAQMKGAESSRSTSAPPSSR